MKNNRFARFARAFFIFGHSADVLVLSTTWNDLFCSCEDDVSTIWQMVNFVFLSLKRWFQFKSWIVRTHFATMMTLNNSQMTAETRSYIFRWCSCCRRRRVCVNSLVPAQTGADWTKEGKNHMLMWFLFLFLFFLFFAMIRRWLRSHFKNSCFLFYQGFQTLENNKSARPNGLLTGF